MTRADARRYLVAYDVPDDRRRTRLAKAISGFGDRVQFSVFVVDASPTRLQRLQLRLEGLMNDDEDSVLICDLGQLSSGIEKRFRYLGQARPITDSSSFIV